MVTKERTSIFRKTLCWAVVIFVAAVMLISIDYDVPVTGGRWEDVEKYERILRRNN